MVSCIFYNNYIKRYYNRQLTGAINKIRKLDEIIAYINLFPRYIQYEEMT
jgi:hypothetical protein